MALPTTPSFRLDGKRALVTGASSGIGQACAAALAPRNLELYRQTTWGRLCRKWSARWTGERAARRPDLAYLEVFCEEIEAAAPER